MTERSYKYQIKKSQEADDTVQPWLIERVQLVGLYTGTYRVAQHYTFKLALETYVAEADNRKAYVDRAIAGIADEIDQLDVTDRSRALLLLDRCYRWRDSITYPLDRQQAAVLDNLTTELKDWFGRVDA